MFGGHSMNWSNYDLNYKFYGVVGVVCLLLMGCKHIEYIPVETTHTEHHWHTDSVKERDSTHTERETIIRELDSAAMAQYGIQMENNQKAWLVFQRDMEERLRELEHKEAVRDTVRDSIPKPYPVEVVKTKATGWWAFWGLIVAIVTIGAIGAIAIKRLKN